MSVDLTQYPDDGGDNDWLPAGHYAGRVTAAKWFQTRDGVQGGVEVHIVTAAGGKAKGSWYNSKSSGKYLYRLGRSCGLPDSDLRKFNPDMLLNLHFGFSVIPQEKNPKYHEIHPACTWPESENVPDWAKAAVSKAVARAQREPEPAANTAPPPVNSEVDVDSIPF